VIARRLLLAILLCFPAVASADTPRVAIIIDDLGYHLANGLRALELPETVSYSFLPGGPRSRSLAERAHELGRDVLLHLPLQAYQDEARAEPAEIHLDMSRSRVSAVFDEALASVPYVIGINSHRGSLLTRHPGHMQWLMEEISQRDNLFFIDSYTHHKSVALQIARENGIAAIKRDVFLDPDASPETVAREFERMKKLARERGQVVAIGHPHPATLELLEQQLPRLAEEGFELVRVRDLLP
jgi:polysaccharide deacetylase 2 family uncharacterized protein YibQ